MQQTVSGRLWQLLRKGSKGVRKGSRKKGVRVKKERGQSQVFTLSRQILLSEAPVHTSARLGSFRSVVRDDPKKQLHRSMSSDKIYATAIPTNRDSTK
jgi:hypothetical protein